MFVFSWEISMSVNPNSVRIFSLLFGGAGNWMDVLDFGAALLLLLLRRTRAMRALKQAAGRPNGVATWEGVGMSSNRAPLEIHTC
jgi:hypothetical protein